MDIGGHGGNLCTVTLRSTGKQTSYRCASKEENGEAYGAVSYHFHAQRTET